jgi:hypothetical protein
MQGVFLKEGVLNEKSFQRPWFERWKLLKI